jgi:hypothetical protein
VLKCWNQASVEPRYDKHLLKLEIDLIRHHIPDGAKAPDAGCREGEGTKRCDIAKSAIRV